MSTVSSTIEVRAKPEQVWSLITDGPRMPEWLTPVKALEERPPTPLVPRAQFKAVIGRMAGGKIKITDVIQNRRLAWRAGPPLAHMMGMPMKVSVELAPTGQGTTRVTFTSKSAMIMPMLMKMMAGISAKEEVPKTAQAIKRVVEGNGVVS